MNERSFMLKEIIMVVLISLMAGPLMAQEGKVTSLITKDLTEFSGKEGLMITVDYAPGGSDPIHRHDAHAFVYVLEGSIVKDVGTVWQQQLPHKARDLTAFLDGDKIDRRRFDLLLAHAINVVPKLTIQGGTSEVLRGIIARGLGLR